MSVQTTMKKVLLMAQIFGFMPVNGVLQTNAYTLKFYWVSWRMLYAILTLLGMTFMSYIQLKIIISYKIDMVDIYRQVSYMAAICSSILLIKLAKEWPRLIKRWNAVERSMVGHYSPTVLNGNVNRILLIFFALLSLRYSLTQLHQWVRAVKCTKILGDGEVFKYFLKLKFFNVYALFECNVLSGILLLYVNIQIIFSHTIVDVLIMIVSESLASRMSQVTRRIKSVALAGVKSEDVWIELREDYNKLECLCKLVNSHISYLIILSYLRNLIMLLIHLFNSLKIRRYFTERLYFYYSFGFIVISTVSVCIIGSTVNDESKKALRYLYNVPDGIYNKEVERLIRQISTNSMALSGLNFFSIKRDLVLTIASALVTYELILIQFAGDFLKSDNTNSTSCSPR